MFKGNIDNVMEDAGQIVKRLKSGSGRISQLMKEYHCCYSTIMKAVLSQISKAQWKRIRKKILAQSGIKNRFKKGHIPHNKYKKGMHYSPATEFKKGHLPANHMPVGTIRIVERTRKGKTIRFREIIVSGLKEGKHKWIPYARYLWEQKHGPVPKGYFVVHADGDTMNDEPSNFKLVNRSGHLKLQIKRDPKMLVKCRKKAAKATKKRHARNRRIKEKLRKQAEREKRQLLIQCRKDRADAETLEKLRRPVNYWWECTGCGYVFGKQEPTEPCPKSNGLRSEKIEHRRAIAV